jgi:hypothetical protein
MWWLGYRMHDNTTMVGFPAGTNNFFLSKMSRPSQVHIQAPTQWLPDTLSLEKKRLGHETDNSPPLLHVELHLKSYTCLHSTHWKLIILLDTDVVLTSQSEKANSSEQSNGSINTWWHKKQKIQTIMSVANYCNFFYLTSPVVTPHPVI